MHKLPQRLVNIRAESREALRAAIDDDSVKQAVDGRERGPLRAAAACSCGHRAPSRWSG